LAICQLMWEIRDEDLLNQVAFLIARVSTNPALEMLGIAIAKSAPKEFAEVAAAVRDGAEAAVKSARADVSKTGASGTTTEPQRDDKVG